jgi:hypothetical protein
MIDDSDVTMIVLLHSNWIHLYFTVIDLFYARQWNPNIATSTSFFLCTKSSGGTVEHNYHHQQPAPVINVDGIVTVIHTNWIIIDA